MLVLDFDAATIGTVDDETTGRACAAAEADAAILAALAFVRLFAESDLQQDVARGGDGVRDTPLVAIGRGRARWALGLGLGF